MSPFIDARIPLVFGRDADAAPGDALLREGEGEPGPGYDWFLPAGETAHPARCACCTPRNGAGMALARLTLARGRGTGAFFTRVVVVARSEAGKAAVRAALEGDPIASGYFREVK